MIQAFREALQNVVKHSGADVTTVMIALRGRDLIVQVSDNGCGIDEASPGVGKDGFKNMRRRIESVDGTCTVTSDPGGGTVVRFVIPLNDDPTA